MTDARGGDGAGERAGDLRAAWGRLAPGRRVHGIAAALLPFRPEGGVDWAAFEHHVARTRAAGLDVAVNMDTGFGDLLAPEERAAVLDATRRALGGAPFYAGAYADASPEPGKAWHEAAAQVEARGGTPVLVPARALQGAPAAQKAAAYRAGVEGVERALAFELSPVFAPHGELWDAETFERLMEIPQLAGAKHSSLDRGLELERIEARDRSRPEFRVYTGNDLGIDMVAYGSDYLLGLATFAPERFAERDRALEAGELAFLARNDALQHLGAVGFRAPVPAYKHSAALYLQLTGGLEAAEIHPEAPRRPQSERILLLDCARRLGEVADPERAYAERVAPYLESGEAGPVDATVWR